MYGTTCEPAKSKRLRTEKNIFKEQEKIIQMRNLQKSQIKIFYIWTEQGWKEETLHIF